jgi:serine kinase of HPr protein (carbohydrate metabolism regulator)
MAIVRPEGKILRGNTARVRVYCLETSARTSCEGTFRLSLAGKNWNITEGRFAGVGSGEAVWVESKLSRQGKKHARKHCQFKTQAVVTSKATVSLADVDQRPVTLKRSPRC